MRGKTIRISEEELAVLQKARNDLMNRGLHALPFLPKVCPKCLSQIQEFDVRTEYFECRWCMYKPKSIKKRDEFALGNIVLLGATALIELLKKKY